MANDLLIEAKMCINKLLTERHEKLKSTIKWIKDEPKSQRSVAGDQRRSTGDRDNGNNDTGSHVTPSSRLQQAPTALV